MAEEIRPPLPPLTKKQIELASHVTVIDGAFAGPAALERLGLEPLTWTKQLERHPRFRDAAHVKRWKSKQVACSLCEYESAKKEKP